MVTGVRQAMNATHLVDASASAKATLDRLNQTSAALWPAAKQPPALNAQALPPGSRQVFVKPSAPQLQLGHHVDQTGQQFAQGVTSQLKAFKDVATHATYDVANGVLGGLPNRTLERLGDAAPPWAQELVKHNQTQWETDGRKAMNALRALPQAAQNVAYQSLGLPLGPAGVLTTLAASKWAPDSLRGWGHGQLSAAQEVLSTFKASWAMPSMEGVLHRAGQSTPTALGERLVAAMLAMVSRGQGGKNQLEQIIKGPGPAAKDVTNLKPNDGRRAVVTNPLNNPADLSSLFWKSSSGVLTFRDAGHRTRFHASAHGDSMKINFSTHRRAESLDGHGLANTETKAGNGRVTHRYGNGNGEVGVYMPDGRYVLSHLASRSSDMQAQLFGAALRRFHQEGVRINRVELDRNMLGNGGWQNVSTVLKGFETSLTSTPALQRQMANNLKKAVFETPLGKTAYRQGFDNVKPRVSANGQIEGVVLMRANTR